MTRATMLLLALTILGCRGGSTTDDAGSDADATPDSPSGRCVTASDCDDAVFCNGEETCSPADAIADSRGCVPGAPVTCTAGQACSASEDRCVTDCDVAMDGDGDGAVALACGGDDCDDADPGRFPGNPEVCDAMNVDEDCDGTTFGSVDLDGDTYPDAVCCNEASGALLCGTDCDDGEPDVHPAQAEVCNGVDDNCSGEVDEGLVQSYFADCDADGWGTGEAIVGCAEPSTPPPSCSAVSWATVDGDCDDSRAEAHPSADEVCDGFDDDCDATVDGSAADAWCNTEAPLASVRASAASCVAGACVPTACATPYLDCDSDPDCEVDSSDDRASCGTCGNTCIWECGAGTCDDAEQLDAGAGHTCTVRTTGHVACWGKNDHGQLGDSTSTNRDAPVDVVGLDDATEVTTGGSALGVAHSCALRSGG